MMKNNRIAALSGVLIAVAALAGCGEGDARSRKAQGAAVPVSVASVTERAVPVVIRAAGVVEATASVTVVSRVDGPIVQVFVRDGQDVKVGEPLLQIDPEPYRIQVRAAEAAVARDKALLTDAASKEARGKALLEQHYISNEEYLQLQSAHDSAKSTVMADEAALDQARLQLGYTTVRAPVAGKIGHIALQVGNTVRAASPEPLTTLNALDTVDVSFAVPEQNLAQIRHALASSAAIVQVPPSDGEGAVLEGKVTFVDNTIDRTSGTIRLRARFDNRSRELWPGQFVTASLSLATKEVAVVVPSVAIAEGPEGSYVFVVGADLAAEQRTVKVTRLAGDDALVSGVKPGERVVVDGQSRLTPGTRVRIREQPAAA